MKRKSGTLSKCRKLCALKHVENIVLCCNWWQGFRLVEDAFAGFRSIVNIGLEGILSFRGSDAEISSC